MVLTQTTLSVDETKDILAAIRARYPHAKTPPKDDICYATQNRQDAVRELMKMDMDVLLVIGSKNSSNSQRLCEVARDGGVDAYLIDEAHEIQTSWLENKNVVGVTAGASAPENLVEEVLLLLKDRFNAKIQDVLVRDENVVFSLPKELSPETVTN